MNTFIRGFVLISILFNYSKSFAYDCEVDGIYYNRLSSNEVEVTHKCGKNKLGWGSYEGDVVIPVEITYAGRKMSVTQIGEYAFRSCEKLKSISIPTSIRKIGKDAFECTINIESLYISSLEQWINMESEGQDGIPTGKKTYVNGDIVSNLIIPKETKKIPDYRFMSWYEVKSVKIPDGVTYIGRWAFHSCINLENIEIPNSVKEICYEAFGGSKLKTIELPNQLTKLECLGCYQLSSITVPESVTEIGDGAFRDYRSLIEIKMSENVTTIGGFAFYDCISLRDIRIPQNVISIGKHAFQFCTNLTDIYLCSDNPPIIDKETFDESHYTWANLYVPYNCTSKYKNANIWKLFYDIKEFNPSHIDIIYNSDKITHIYTIEGVKKDNIEKGINIIRTENGNIRKELHR